MRTCALVLSVVLALSIPQMAWAQSAMTPAAVVALDEGGDGRIVTLRGEAIGDVLRADDGHKWVNLLGDGVALGVWMTAEDASAIDRLGDYRATGATVEVTGRYNSACVRHAGDRDVHAHAVRIVRGSAVRVHDIGWWKVAVAATASALALIAERNYRRRRRIHTD